MFRKIIRYLIAFVVILLVMFMASLLGHADVLSTYFSSVVNSIIFGFAAIAILAGFAGLFFSMIK